MGAICSPASALTSVDFPTPCSPATAMRIGSVSRSRQPISHCDARGLSRYSSAAEVSMCHAMSARFCR
jgi:hypothetical protein